MKSPRSRVSVLSCRLKTLGLETEQSSNIQLLEITASRQGWQDARLQSTAK